MIDLNQELEDFDAYFLKRHGELPLDPTSEEYANKSYLKHEMFKAWKARAKAQAVPEGYVLMPKECPAPIFADSFFNYLRSKCYTEEKGFEYIYLSDIDETEIWNFAVNASESGAEG